MAGEEGKERIVVNFKNIAPEMPVKDIMCGAARIEYPMAGHNYLALVDVMPRLVPADQQADYRIVQAARTSYQGGTKKVNEDRGLIRHLMRHRHTSPVEMVEFLFHCRMPIFVARQWIRHRTASVNEVSGRYSELPGEFYIPDLDNIRKQSKTNKQGSDGEVDEYTARTFRTFVEIMARDAYEKYQWALQSGIAKEQARIGLPLNLYTEWYWKIDLHNLLHFLGLRMDKHAQQEIREFAEAMFALIQPMCPTVCEAFMDYHPNMGGMLLTRLEIEAFHKSMAGINGHYKVAPLATDNKGELADWEAKKKRLGL